MKMTTTNKLPTSGCWIHENKRYRCTLPIASLPYVDAEYEGILKAHDIPYRKFVQTITKHFGELSSKEICEYWNPGVFEENDLSLPLYATMPDGSYYYCGKNYSEKVITSDTSIAAKKTQKFVEEKIEEYKKILQEVELYKLAKSAIGDGIAEMCYSEQLSGITESATIQVPLKTPINTYCFGILLDTEEFDTISYYYYDFNMNHDSYKIVKSPRTYWVAIFNMNKIASNGHITLKVPKQIAGLIIGREHSNINGWAKVIGVEEINVVPI